MRREPGTCCRDLVEIERCDVCENGCLGYWNLARSAEVKRAPGERTPPRCKEKDEICGVYSQFSILKTQELKRVKCDVSVSK